jgi:hypothetical protein
MLGMPRIVLLLPLVILAGCGDGGGGLGQAAAFLTDPPTAAFSGELDGDVQVSISEDGTSWVDFGAASAITVALQTANVRAVVGGQEVAVPAGSYSWARLTLSGAEALLTAPATVEDTLLLGNVTLPIGGSDGQVVVAIQVPAFEVTASESVRRSVTFALNSEAWITKEALRASSVEDSALEGAVTVAVSTEPRT